VKGIQVTRAGGSFELIDERMREPEARYVRVKVQAAAFVTATSSPKRAAGLESLIHDRPAARSQV